MTRRELKRREFLTAAAAALLPRPVRAASPAPFRFTDIAAQAGLTEPIVYGNPDTKKYILETNGCGIAFFDYDHDGWLDIFVPGGSRLDGSPPQTSNRLYRNNRDGTFTDVTKKAGLERAGCTSRGRFPRHRCRPYAAGPVPTSRASAGTRARVRTRI